MMKFIDLNGQYKRIQASMDKAVLDVLAHGQYVMGPEVSKLEKVLSNFCGVQHCIGTSNGTSALGLALMALGIGPGDEVITSPFSFFASVEVIVLLGAKPIFVDIDPRTYNLNPHLLEQAITEKTKAIMPINLYGQTAEYKIINEISSRYGLPVIEDAAQSFGATHYQERSGSLADISCTSFFPSKPLGCYGDGGACFTNDAKLAEKLRQIANHGQAGRYEHVSLGVNGRLDSIQAAVLLEKIKIFDEETTLRQQVASWYGELLAGHIQTPQILTHNTSVYAQYTIQTKQRARVQQCLQEKGIPTAVHYPKGLHQQPAILALGHAYPDFPVTETASQEVLSLPFHPYLQQADVQLICDNLLAIVASCEVN